MIKKRIHSQDSNFKLSPTKSGETSINLSKEILDYISPGLMPGNEKKVVFKLYKSDFLKGISFISSCLPLYKSSSQNSWSVELGVEFFSEMIAEVNSLFSSNDVADYEVNLKYRLDDRIYLNGLSVSDFNIRHFLVEEKTIMTFDKKAKCEIRLMYGESDYLIKEKVLRNFCKEVILKLHEIDQLGSFSNYFTQSRENYLQIKYDNKLLYRLLNPNILDADGGVRWFDEIITLDGTQYIICAEWTRDENRSSVPSFVILKSFVESLYHGRFELYFEDGYYYMREVASSETSSFTQERLGYPLQQIWYGAPGTGKSHEIKEQTAGAGKAVVRTTFHPDSDYSTFVGAYKPVMDEVDVKVTPVVTTGGVSFSPASDMKEKRISYRFVKQAFMKAYLGAWKKYADNPQNPEPQYLVIEEINRGNCAQIFGDIFQLLDRSDKGFSEYPIEADEDLRQEIARSFAEEVDYKLSADLAVDGVVDDYTSNYGATLSEDIQQGRVMLLPSNLYIWATMNTSDQSLFPIDSAFKRRWEWKYMSIKDCSEGYKIVLGNGKEYDWYDFISKMNGLIADKTDSEDKQMGYFFIKAENGKITSDRFVNKVLFYLYNDVFKSYDLPTEFGNKKFTAFFTDTDTKVAELLDDLDVKKLNEPDSAEASEDTAEE